MFASFRRFGKYSSRKKAKQPPSDRGFLLVCVCHFVSVLLSYVVVRNLRYSQNWSQVHAAVHSMFFFLTT